MKEVKGLLANCQILRTIAWLSSSKDREIDAGDSPPLLNGRPAATSPSKSRICAEFLLLGAVVLVLSIALLNILIPARAGGYTLPLSPATLLSLCLCVSVSLFHASHQLLNSETACLNSTEHPLFFLSSQAFLDMFAGIECCQISIANSGLQFFFAVWLRSEQCKQ
jgi:hypothetical protein